MRELALFITGRRIWGVRLNQRHDILLSSSSVNLVGPFFMAAAFLPLLGKATAKNYGFSASVVNITSISGITKTAQNHMPYNASKAAAIQLTDMLALNCADAGTKVRVNSIAPGTLVQILIESCCTRSRLV